MFKHPARPGQDCRPQARCRCAAAPPTVHQPDAPPGSAAAESQVDSTTSAPFGRVERGAAQAIEETAAVAAEEGEVAAAAESVDGALEPMKRGPP